ncbi:protein shortage in chiasmata 1 ortholog-like isoform X2 [Argopecten irradians]|uniref:protein shortage in chiasmata 1 ortholog-like isoform X2 n=1 Tax=Argopecten irradians TaxID=31199 RepID=UPI0037127C0D
MLIYKGINYLEDALDQRQRILQQGVVSVPHHLEHVDMYRHTGKLPDNNFREPWKRAKADLKLLRNEGTRLEAELNCLSELVSKQIKEIEFLGRDQLDSVEHGVFDLGECIPSSNPSSQEDFPEDNHPEENTRLNSTEVFLKENIQHWLNDCSSDLFKLEEVFMSDPLPELSRNLPSLNAMCGCLHPNQVSDPLNTRASGLLALKDRITHNEHLIPDDHCDIRRCEISAEDWQKFDLPRTDGELEECLFPFENESDRGEAIINSTKIAIELDTSVLMEVKSHASDVCERLTSIDVCNKYKNEVEKVDTDLSSKSTQSFLEINEIGYDDDDDFDFKKALLDTPLGSPCVENWTNYDLKQSLAQLCSHRLPHGNNRLLTLEQKDSSLWRIWQHEKYMDDILSLRLPEFGKKPIFDIDIGPNKAKAMLNLKADEELGKIELSLCWDAVSVAAAKIKGFKIEKLEEEESYKCITTEILSVERFEKDTSTVLLEEKDPILENVSGSESRTDMTKSKLKAEKAKVWKPTVRSCSTAPSLRPPLGLSKAGADPLNDFLFLRSVQDVSTENHSYSKALNRTPEPKDQHFPVMVKTAESPQMSPSDLDIQNICVIKPNKRQKTWDHRVVSVTIQGEFASVLDIIKDQASYYMAALKGCRDIHLPNRFSDITPDNTRFLVKQKEKSLQDNKENGAACDLYKATIALHILCGARDILIYCCFESALAHIKSMQEKYQSVLKNCFDSMMRELTQLKCNFNQRRLFHPKLVSLYRHIDERLQKSAQNKDETKEKILIVIGQDRLSLKSCLRDFVRGGSTTKADLLSDLSGDLTQRLESVTCLIANGAELFDEFPWSQFTVVIDYNDSAGDDTKLHDICKGFSIPLISLNGKTNHDSANSKTGTSTEVGMATQNMDTVTALTIIGSRYLTSQPELLQLLETRHNLTIMERDYDQIKSIDEMYFADLVIDERTCVVVQSVHDMAEVWQYELFNSKILTLSLKFTTCWIIFYHSQKSKMQNSCVKNINRFRATVENLDGKRDFFIKTFITNSASEAAMFVRQVCDTSEKMSAVWKDGSWRKRAWLTEECSEEEKTLLSFPCFNSFSAQLVLQKMSVAKLCSSSYSELSLLLPWMPQKFLKSFLDMVSSEKGKELSQEPFDRSQPVDDSPSLLEDYDNFTIQQSPTLQRKTSGSKLECELLAMDKFTESNSFGRKCPGQCNQFIDIKHQEVFDSDQNNSIAMPGVRYMYPSAGEVLDKLEEAQFGTDTQDSQDILSLNGSQPSVKLNEFQRAELEGQNAIASKKYTGAWNIYNEMQQDGIGGESYRKHQENVHSHYEEVHQKENQFCSELPVQEYQKTNVQKNMKLGNPQFDSTVVEYDFEKAVNLEVARRLKAQQFNSFGMNSVDANMKNSYDEVKDKTAYEDEDYSDRHNTQLQDHNSVSDQTSSAYFERKNNHYKSENFRGIGKENSLKESYRSVSDFEFQKQHPMNTQRNNQIVAGWRQEDRIQPQEDQSSDIANNMYRQPRRENHLDCRLGLREIRFDRNEARRPPQGHRSFAGDLTLITQNILQKATSSELPRKSPLVWPPPRRVSIGLAPPRPREDSTSKDSNQQMQTPVQNYPDVTRFTPQRTNVQSCYDGQRHQRNEKYEKHTYTPQPWDGHSSLWSSYDSPPMDLDRSPDNESNKAYYALKQSDERPRKEVNQKQLSYRRVPGSKGGQTKLVFKGK